MCFICRQNGGGLYISNITTSPWLSNRQTNELISIKTRRNHSVNEFLWSKFNYWRQTNRQCSLNAPLNSSGPHSVNLVVHHELMETINFIQFVPTYFFVWEVLLRPRLTNTYSKQASLRTLFDYCSWYVIILVPLFCIRL